MLKEIKLKTLKKQEIIGITSKVKEIVKASKVKEGICLVYVAHTTAGILINENDDPNVYNDIIDKFEELIPSKGKYKHNCIDNNAHSHIKASLIGASETTIIQNNELVLGRWQGIFFAEFDGPRERTIFVKIIEG